MEHIENIEMGSQLTLVGIINPKLLKHDQLGNIHYKILIDTKIYFVTQPLRDIPNVSYSH